jgi:SAM-dependent methyltransferase
LIHLLLNTKIAPLGTRMQPQVRWRYDTDAARSPWRTAYPTFAQKGLPYLLRFAALWIAFPLWRLVLRVFPRRFTYQGRPYACFLHTYNSTWSNERAVEIPIVWAAVQGVAGGRVLEVGNVLPHYFAAGHEVIDKFEQGAAVRNEDVATFRSEVRYDLIVSISTLEHVGWDEQPHDPAKIGRALLNLRDHLAPGGRLLVTLPLGYNPSLDAQLAAGSLPFSRCDYLKREGLLRWRQAAWEEVAGASYARRWPGTDGLVIGVVER